MKSKYFFEQHKELVNEEHKEFKTHKEEREVMTVKCDHKGKVKPVPGGIRCSCGAGWIGPRVNVLLDHFNRVL